MIKEKLILPIRDHVLALRDRIPALPGMRFAGECIRKYQWVGILLLIAALGLLAFETGKGPVRWREDIEHWKAIHLQEGDVDFAIFGSSRTQRAVDAQSVHDAMVESGKVEAGKTPVVYDFARSQRGLGHVYVMASELFRNRRVKRIAVEFNSTHNRYYHDLFYLKASVGDLAFNYHSEPHKGKVVRIRDAWKMYVERVSKRAEQMLRDESFPDLKDASKIPAVTTDCTGGPRETEPSVLIHFEEEWKNSFFDDGNDWDLDEENEIRNDFYVKKLIELARENDCEISFFFVAGRYSVKLSGNMLEKLERRYGVPFYQPSDETLREWFDENAFSDPSHMNAEVGAPLFSEWLVKTVL